LETEKKDKENKVLKIDNELKQSVIERHYILLLFVIVVAGLLVTLAIIYLRGREKEKKNNQILEQQKQEIELHHQQITDGINYASRIQGALLPEISLLKNSVKDYFILYKPRDIVSGDFYWSKQIKNQLVVVAADCTGHGVPGAFMSLLGISLLTEILSTQIVPEATTVLEKLRQLIKDSLKQDDSHKTTKDGIDMALCIINTETLELQFAGANMPMYLIRKGKLEIFKGINNPIGIHLKEKPFENIRLQLLPGDSMYLFTDGFVDQFGGKKSEKFKPTHFRNALLAISQSDMATQKQMLDDIFEEWKTKANDQTDDVLVLGLKV
jgi:serine phosphatase RsbU (regulator of sigma subunit)